MSRNIEHVSEVRFNEKLRLLGNTNLPVSSQQAAKMVMVNKKTVAEAAAKYGLHAQSLRRVIRNINGPEIGGDITLIAKVDGNEIQRKIIDKSEYKDLFFSNSSK